MRTIVQIAATKKEICTMVATLEDEIILVSKFLLNKKTVIVSNFCLIGKIPHDFLTLKSIESAWKTL